MYMNTYMEDSASQSGIQTSPKDFVSFLNPRAYECPQFYSVSSAIF